MDFVTKFEDSTTLEAPTIPPTSIRPASPLLPPPIPEEEDPPSLPKIIKPSLVSAFGFSVEDLTEIGDPFASPRRTKKEISEEQTRSEEPSQQQTLHKSSSSEILILTPKQLPPPAPENVPIEAIPSAHGTFLNPTDKIPDSFMKQLESLRESAKRRELAKRREEEEEARKRELESTKTTEKESKTPTPSSSVPSTTAVKSETPYYEGLGLSSSLFSSPEKHDMEIAMYVVFNLFSHSLTYTTHVSNTGIMHD